MHSIPSSNMIQSELGRRVEICIDKVQQTLTVFLIWEGVRDMYYAVCEVVKRLELSPHTLHFYTKERLLNFVDRDQNGNRIFKEEDFKHLFMIVSLKRAGMTIKQIKRFI